LLLDVEETHRQHRHDVSLRKGHSDVGRDDDVDRDGSDVDNDDDDVDSDDDDVDSDDSNR
jgi:hypothetical protein